MKAGPEQTILKNFDVSGYDTVPSFCNNVSVFSASLDQGKEEQVVFSMDNDLHLSEGFEMKGEKRAFLEGSKELHKVRCKRTLLFSLKINVYIDSMTFIIVFVQRIKIGSQSNCS